MNRILVSVQSSHHPCNPVILWILVQTFWRESEIIGISPLNRVKLNRKQYIKKDVKSIVAILQLIRMNV